MSSIEVVLDEESSLEDAPSAGGGPPAPPGPLAKAGHRLAAMLQEAMDEN